MKLKDPCIMTEKEYDQYVCDFNIVFAGDSDFNDFYTKYYEPSSTIEYIQLGMKNIGKDAIISSWKEARKRMVEKIQPHHSFILSNSHFAVEGPVDFQCKKNVEWMNIKYKPGDLLRFMVASFYELSSNGKFKYVRAYPIYHLHYQIDKAC